MALSTAARQAVFTYLYITQEINFSLDMIPMVSEHSPCLLSLLHLALCYLEMLASAHLCTLAPPPLVFVVAIHSPTLMKHLCTVFIPTDHVSGLR